MKKLLIALTAAAFTLLSGSLVLAAGASVDANPDSKTGYTVTFTYENPDAQAVQLVGAFNFYKVNDIYVFSSETVSKGGGTIPEDHIYTPETWEPGMAHMNDAGYVADMTKGEDGVWSISLDLPCACYLYQYRVTDAAGETTTITDPANIPWVNDLGAAQVRSQVFVPFDADKQAPKDDWTYIFPVEDEAAKGSIIWTEVEGATFEGQETNLHEIMIYLPADFDAEREEPYKVLYIAHGGGGEEGDWFYQGHIDAITDRLIASGELESFIIVCNDRSKGTDEENTAFIVNDLMPYMAENYNASTEPADNAVAGLSAGGKLAYAVYVLESDKFGYFGFFSSAFQAATYDFTAAVADPVIYFGCGYADPRITLPTQEGRIPMGTLCIYLDQLGIDYVGLKLVDGAHDWFTWPQLYYDFVMTTLWK